MESHIISTTGQGVGSLEKPLKADIMRRIDKIARLAARRVLANARGDKGELLQIAAEYAACKWMENTARQVAMEAQG